MLTKERLLEMGVTEEQANSILKDINEDTIPKYRYNEVAKERDDLKGQVADRDKQINDLSKNKGDAEELQKEITNLQEENKANKDKFEKEIANIKKENAIEQYLQQHNVTNVKAAKRLLDSDAISFEKDELKGIEDQLKELKEDKSLASLFVEEKEPEKPVGYDVTNGNQEPSGKGLFDSILSGQKDNNEFNPWNG